MDSNWNRRPAPPRAPSGVRARLVVTSVLLLLSARAESQGTPATRLAEVALLAAGGDSLRRPQDKSESMAFLLSTGGLLVPVGAGLLLASHTGGSNQDVTGTSLIVGGLMLGPSAGYFYGGCSRRAWVGIGIRAGIAAATLAVMSLTAPTGGFDVDIFIGGVGASLVALEGVYECLTVGDCVRHPPSTRRVGLGVGPGSGPRSLRVVLHATF